MIPQSFIQDLLNRVDIVEVIDRHVKLKRAGANFSACCPFHNEKTPSFTVSQTKQFYHCFGCGAHGTAVGFLMEYNGMGFIDAVRELAQSVGMAVPEEPRSAEARQKASEDLGLHAVLSQASQYYRGCLRDSPIAIDYLKRRGLSGEIAKQFGIGYAPDGWQNLAQVFTDYQQKSLLSAGLVKQNDEGRRYDVFRDRIMFPIVDVRGNIIGFGGRVLDKGEPKYLNSPETPVFEKGRELYGLFQARRAIRDAGRVLVVEGYMDVVALAQSGVGYAVATLGTATTPVHVQRLLRQSDEVVFCFDGDTAGKRAAWRALENSLAQLVDGKQLRFLFLPDGEDPDSYVRQHGRESFEGLLQKAMPLSQFLIEGLLAGNDRQTPEGRARILQRAKPLLRQIVAPVMALLIRKEVAEIAGLSPAELEQHADVPPPVTMSPAPVRRQAPVTPSALRTALELLVLDVRLASVILPADWPALDNLGGSERDIVAVLRRMWEASGSGAPAMRWGELFRGDEHETLVRDAEAAALRWQDRGLDSDALMSEFRGAWRQALDGSRRVRIRALLDKSRLSGLSEAEQIEYRLLQQALSAPFEK